MNDGGPAFPRMYPRSDEDGTTGMSLRDYFAAAALQGLLANSFDSRAQTYAPADFDHMANTVARAYNYSDAMLKARHANPTSDDAAACDHEMWKQAALPKPKYCPQCHQPMWRD